MVRSFNCEVPDDYLKELERLKALVTHQRSFGREIVVVMGLGFVGAVMAAVIADIEDSKRKSVNDSLDAT